MSLLDNWNEISSYDDPSTSFAGGTATSSATADRLQRDGFGMRSPRQADPQVSQSSSIFSFRRLKVEKDQLHRFAVANSICVCAYDALKVARFRIHKKHHTVDGEIEVFEIPRDRSRTDDYISNLFLHPSGYHLIIVLRSGECFILSGNSKKPRQLKSPRGVVFLSVAWDKVSGSTNPRELLIGTNVGAIFKTNLDAKEFKLVYSLGENMPITGLEYEMFPDQAKYFVMATTPTRIYQFVGEAPFESLFDQYRLNPSFHELPGNLNSSEMHFFSKYDGVAKSFAWLTATGIYHGHLVFGSQGVGDPVMTDSTLIQYPRLTEGDDPQRELPISLAITEFHFLLLTTSTLIGICRVNEEVVLQEPLSRHHFGQVIHLARDPIENTLWVLTRAGIYEIVVVDEDRDMWHIFLKKGEYEEAVKYCRTDTQRFRVLTSQADTFFEGGKFELAARYYARTNKPFEEVALQFIQSDRRDALKTYLLEKLKTFPQGERTQRTLVATWLTETYLDMINQSAAAADAIALHFQCNPDEREMEKEAKEHAIREEKAKGDALCEECKAFLAEHLRDVDRKTTFTLLSSHGRVDLLLFYATLIEDYERVISHYLQKSDFGKALDVMQKQTNREIVYKFSPILMRHIPVQTVSAWMSVDRHILNPRKLIPALMEYDATKPGALGPDNQHQAIRYLQHCISHLGNIDSTVHNFLVLLYAQHEDETLILSFLNSQEAKPYYDAKFALRMCSKYGKTHACILIYGSLGMYEEAVKLAVSIEDYSLAKIHADKPLDDELRKKLWLSIARAVIVNNSEDEHAGIKQALVFVSQCDLLKIEDILPFFPNFVQIDDFKEEICSSLEEYNKHIEELKKEMEQATSSANLIRRGINNLRNRHGFVGPAQCCHFCKNPVLADHFFLFPCDHVFHGKCLTSYLLQEGSAVTRARVKSLQEKIIEELAHPTQVVENQKADNAESDGTQSEPPVIDQLRVSLDECVGAQCPLCGDLMVASVEQPLISEKDKVLAKSWEI